MGISTRWGLPLAYTATCLIWGSTYLAIKVGLESFQPFFYAGVRFALATVLAFAVARWQGVSFAGPLRRWWRALAVGVLFIAICNGLIFWAETRLDSGFTALLITANPLWVALLTPLFPGERRLGPRSWAGVAVGLVGSVVIINPTRMEAFALTAALAVLGSVVIWSATSLWVRSFRDSYHPLALTVVQMASGAVILLAASALHGPALAGPVTARAVAALAFLVVFGSLVVFFAYFYLLQHWDAARVASSTYINPVVALFLGAVLLGEAITWNMLLGGAIVLFGVTLVLRR